MCFQRENVQCYCGCWQHGRRFFTKKERIEQLEKYKEQLQKELKGIDEYLKEQK